MQKSAQDMSSKRTIWVCDHDATCTEEHSTCTDSVGTAMYPALMRLGMASCDALGAFLQLSMGVHVAIMA